MIVQASIYYGSRKRGSKGLMRNSNDKKEEAKEGMLVQHLCAWLLNLTL
jgi:hypothetical protein